jgi:hypothetical protein
VHLSVTVLIGAESAAASTGSRSSTTSMVADSLCGSTPMTTLPTPFLLALERRLKAGRAMRLP